MAAGAAGFAIDNKRWPLAGALVGCVPLAVGFALGTAFHQVLSAFGGLLLLLAAARQGRAKVGIAAVAWAFVSHSILAILLSRFWPTRAAACFPEGATYWVKQLHWIVSGHDPEYVMANWLPAHFQLLGAMVLFTYVSLGLATMLQGFYEVDLMNYYVGRLLASSDGSPLSLLLGWHPWSVLRGVCYTVLMFEVASWSLSRLTGRELSTVAARRWRWGIAGVFFALDCIVKLGATEAVRSTLAAHLVF